MKYYIIAALMLVSTACKVNQAPAQTTPPQPDDKMPFRPDMVKITFPDGKIKYANAISQSATEIQVRMIPNSEEITITNKGVIKTGSGSYTTGSKVQGVMVKKALASIYDKVDQANFDYGTLGIRFPDGKVQYAGALTVSVYYLSLTMSHSKFNYQAYFKSGQWKIDNAGGEYKADTYLRDVYELEKDFKKFY